MVYFLWKAIYASAGTDVVNGMTFSDTLIYLVLATALFNFMEMYAVWEIGRAIQSGKIVLDLLKPMKYRTYLFWSLFGHLCREFFLTFLPDIHSSCDRHSRCCTPGTEPAVFRYIGNGGNDKLQHRLYRRNSLSLHRVDMGNKHNEAGDSTAAVGCDYTAGILPGAAQNSSGLSAFPVDIQRSAVDSSRRLIRAKELLMTLGTQLLWCVVMTVISKLFWKISLPQITVNGG